MEKELINLCVRARAAARVLSHISPEVKNVFFENLSRLLTVEKKSLLEANAIDVREAQKGRLDAARLDRLTLTEKIISQMAAACGEVLAMPDPVGAMDTQWTRPNGLLVGKMRVPLGVIAMIYEARPNVTIDAAILCIKAGNAVILRGGREAAHTNSALARLLARACAESGLPEACAQLVPVADRKAVDILCKQDKYIDVMIPRGGEELVARVTSLATMPVLKHYKGVCHAYIDAGADLDMALGIVENSKAQRPGVCNALECLLVNRKEIHAFLPMLAERLAPVKVVFHADPESLPLLGGAAIPLTREDKGKEFHSLDLAVVVVESLDEALDYIAKYGSNHTEIICTQNYDNAMRFLGGVDAAMVGVNVSTRFNDGGELGLGAEIGISTSKLHAYGPMGVKELTTTKFVVLGRGQVRK